MTPESSRTDKITAAWRNEWSGEVEEMAEIWCVTACLTVNYLALTPFDKEIEGRKNLEEFNERKTLAKSRRQLAGT